MNDARTPCPLCHKPFCEWTVTNRQWDFVPEAIKPLDICPSCYAEVVAARYDPHVHKLLNSEVDDDAFDEWFADYPIPADQEPTDLKPYWHAKQAWQEVRARIVQRLKYVTSKAER